MRYVEQSVRFDDAGRLPGRCSGMFSPAQSLNHPIRHSGIPGAFVSVLLFQHLPPAEVTLPFLLLLVFECDECRLAGLIRPVAIFERHLHQRFLL